MAAAYKVLNTYELLEMIIVQAQPHRIREFKLVSKSWSDTVHNSKAVARARVLRCVSDTMSTFQLPHHCDWDWDGLHDIDHKYEVCLTLQEVDHCAYTTEDWPRLHPIVGQVPVWPRTDVLFRWVLRFELEQLLEDDQDIQDRLDEYVTEPPCSTITLETSFWLDKQGWCGPGDDYENVSWSYRKAGLRLRDLLLARAGLKQAQQGYTSNERFTTIVAVVGIIIAGRRRVTSMRQQKSVARRSIASLPPCIAQIGSRARSNGREGPSLCMD